MRVVPGLILASILLSSPASAFATTVRMRTSLGVIDIELMDNAAPATVANFLSYVTSGAYVNSFFHRSVPGFVIQGGGYGLDSKANAIYAIPANPPVINEFSPARSNKRGTIAMAKLGGNPNSATNQWFFNLADNSANLDSQNGGFTVFGQVAGNGMQVVDAIAARPIVNVGSPFDSLPVLASGPVTAQNLILITAVSVLPSVAITSPVASGQTFGAGTSPLTVSGTASDNVVSVGWTNDRGGSGTASGTKNWSASIALQEGANTITVRAVDAAGNDSVAAIVVNYTDRTKVTASLNQGGSAGIATPGTAGTLQSGYAIAAVNTGNAPYGTAVFGVSQNGIVVSEAGVPASTPTTSARVFVEYATGVLPGPARPGSATIDINTGVAIVNRSAATSNITYTLRDMQGVTVATGHGTLAAGAHRARFLNQLQELAPDFALPPTFSTARWGSLEIRADQPIFVTALRMTTNQRGEPLFTTVPVADLTQALAASPVFFPHVVDGGGYTSTFILMNTSASSQSGMLRYFADDGTPLVVGQAGGVTNSSFRYTIPPGGTYLFQTTGAPAMAQAGSLQLTPDTGSSAPVGAGIFNRTVDSLMVTECGIPAALPTTHALVYVDMTNGHDSGLAIASTTAGALPLILTASQSDGSTKVGSQGKLSIPGNGHSAAFVSQWISGLPADFRGVIDIAATTPFVALTLRFLTNARQDFLITTFPIADLTRPAPTAPLVFSQIADGSGYRTEFILLSSGGAAASTIAFFADDGTPLPVGP